MRIAGALVYNFFMARGWESKAVEDQLAAAEAKKEAQSRPRLTAEEAGRRARKEALMLDRTRIVRELDEARNPRYRALLEKSLAHVEAELSKLGGV
jgi:hypothetical protein